MGRAAADADSRISMPVVGLECYNLQVMGTGNKKQLSITQAHFLKAPAISLIGRICTVAECEVQVVTYDVVLCRVSPGCPWEGAFQKRLQKHGRGFQ